MIRSVAWALPAFLLPMAPAGADVPLHWVAGVGTLDSPRACVGEALEVDMTQIAADYWYFSVQGADTCPRLGPPWPVWWPLAHAVDAGSWDPAVGGCGQSGWTTTVCVGPVAATGAPVTTWFDACGNGFGWCSRGTATLVFLA